MVVVVAVLVVVEQEDLGSLEPGRTKATTAAGSDAAARSARRVLILSYGKGVAGRVVSVCGVWHHTSDMVRLVGLVARRRTGGEALLGRSEGAPSGPPEAWNPRVHLAEGLVDVPAWGVGGCGRLITGSLEVTMAERTSGPQKIAGKQGREEKGRNVGCTYARLSSCMVSHTSSTTISSACG